MKTFNTFLWTIAISGKCYKSKHCQRKFCGSIRAFMFHGKFRRRNQNIPESSTVQSDANDSERNHPEANRPRVDQSEENHQLNLELALQNSALTRQVAKQRKKQDEQRRTILNLRRDLNKFKRKLAKQELSISKNKNSIFKDSTLDVRKKSSN